MKIIRNFFKVIANSKKITHFSLMFNDKDSLVNLIIFI